MKITKAKLRRVRALIDTPEKRARGAYARTKSGRVLSIEDGGEGQRAGVKSWVVR
jgi:hypothetical protein